MTLLELCKKDVIQLKEGAKLGRADDLRINQETAQLEGLILFGRPRMFGLLGRQPDVFIPWCEVEKVGTDVILVNTAIPTEETGSGSFWERIQSSIKEKSS